MPKSISKKTHGELETSQHQQVKLQKIVDEIKIKIQILNAHKKLQSQIGPIYNIDQQILEQLRIHKYLSQQLLDIKVKVRVLKTNHMFQQLQLDFSHF